MRKLILFCCLLSVLRLQAQPAFDFFVTDSDGNSHDLYADYISQGKLVVLEFFFTTCPPCNTHAPFVQNMYQSMKTQHGVNMEMFLVTTLGSDTNAKVAQYKINKNMTMPGVGSDGNSQDPVSDFQGGFFGPFFGTPTFVVIAPNSGQVFFDVRGDTPQETMTLLANLINHLLVPAPPSMLCAVQSPTGQAIDSVRIDVAANSLDTSFTIQGNYKLSGIPALLGTLPYQVTASKNNHPLDGVSTFDLVLISKHILGIDIFQDEWKRIAADVNLSGTVTTFDILEIRRLILGIYDTFPVCKSWVFRPDTGQDVNGYCIAFQGIKKGDVNGSATGSLAPGDAGARAPSVLLRVKDEYLDAGEIVELEFRTPGDLALAGFQGALQFDASALELLGVESATLSGFDDWAWYADSRMPGRLAISWYDPEGGMLAPGAVVFSIRVRALRTLVLSEVLHLSDDGPAPELYTPAPQGWSLAWRAANSPGLWPNPASGYFRVSCLSDRAESAELLLTDAGGRAVYRQPVDLQAGENMLDIRPETLAPGLYTVIVAGKPAGRLFWR